MSLHLVDDSGHLQPEKKITEFLESVAPPGLQRTEDILRAVGVNYHVVGVFGGQSSGKSTLLNTLFGTDFQTLDESVRRGQTTKGAFIGNADASKEGFTAQSTESPILVVDFEGTDGLERGEDQSFERQLSLFGLSMADTLIINMWAVDVGRFNAANLSLLRTIFEVNLQLFSHESYEQEEKPTLLVVLRDFTEDDPTPSITTVRKSFDTIWENIAKPSKFSDCSIDSLFLLKYYVMPHYKLQRNEFAESVTTLRRWFGDHAYPDYLFHHKAMFRGVPMDALPAYLTNCWEAIRTSKDLDIPTQREMLAQHRCKEVRELEMKNFLMFCRHYEERINRGEMLLRLSDTLDKEMEARLSDFHKHTRLYRSEVVAAHAQELEDALVSAAMTTMSRMASAVSTEVLSSMEARVQRVVDDCIHRLLKSAQTLPFAATTTSTASSAEESSAAAAGGEARSSYQMDSAGCQHLASKFWKTMKAELSEVLGDMSSRPPPTHLYGRYASLVAQDDTMRSTVVNTVTESIFKKVSARLASMAENAPETMHRGFERCLSHNPDGTVKFFATTKGLQQAVPAAEQAGMVLLGCLLYFRLELVADDATAHRQGSTDSLSARRVRRDCKVIAVRQNADERNFYFAYGSLDTAPKYPLQVPIAQPSTAGEEAEEKSQGVTPDCILLNEQSAHRAFELFKQKCGFTVQLQLRSIEASKQRLPAWVIPALFILGFNELCYILTSPVLLVFIVVICVVFFQGFIVAQWQAFEETGPTGIVIPMQAALRYIAPLLQGVMAPAGHNNNNNNIVHEGHADDEASAARPTAMHVDPTTQAEQQPPTTIRRRATEKED